MMLSSLTMSARFFLMASRIFCLWRSWSMLPLRCSDQSWCEMVDVCIRVSPAPVCARVRPCAPVCASGPHDALPGAPESPTRAGSRREGEVLPLPPAASLAIEQRAHVLQQLVGADRAVAVVANEAADHLVCLLELLGVRRLRRGCDLDHIAQVGEELLLDGLLQPLMARIVEGLPPAGQRRDADQD